MKNKALLIALGALAAFLLLGALLDWLLPIAGTDRLLLWLGFIAIGTVSAVFLYLHFRPARSAGGGITGVAEIDVAVGSASRRLAASGVAGGKLSRLPVVLVMGPAGSSKTTAVINSGLQPDLLSGDARADSTAPPTSVNLWYAQGEVIVEAGGAVLEDESRWQRLLHHLRPARLGAALGRGDQPARVAVVCFSCEELLRPGASESVPAAARALRARLSEVSQKLGIRLPVYVLFTKADRIPHFEDFTRSLTRDEARQPLGAVLPVAEIGTGEYADRQARRVGEAFSGLFRALAAWRLRILPREAQEAARTGAYEFPREVLKIGGVAESFLIELCRPAQLGLNPFLRGFHFTGVRPIVVSDTAETGSAEPAPQRIPLGATGVFSIHGLQQPRAETPAGAGSRRVPDWVFLRPVFPELVLGDRIARGITAGGRRVDHFRRAGVGIAAAALLLLSGAFALSYSGNRALAAEGITAVRGVEGVRASIAEAPSPDALERLDDLRDVLVGLRRFDREGRPLRYGWGLYIGDDLLPSLRQAYFDRFSRLVWVDARGDLIGSLGALPEVPQETSDYGAAYDALKAHLVTTGYPQESSGAFLAPVVLRNWQLASALDEQRYDLARRQIEFFGDELPFGNPYRDAPVEPVVVRTRSFLQQFTGTDALYQALLAEAGREGSPVQFHRQYPGTENFVRNSFVVPAAFTREGWVHVQAALDDVDRLLTREDWVAGERSVVPAQDRLRLAQELRNRYVADYVGAWREYLRSSSVAPFGGPADAAGKLTQLSGNESPLLQLLALASRHTAVDTTVVARAFQPIHLVVPPGETGQLVSESNAPYLTSLASLQGAMAQVAGATGPARLDALAAASSSADQVNMQVRQMAQAFGIQGDAREIGLSVQRLLLAPVSGAESLARALPSADVNAGGVGFCQPIRALAAKYPFNRSGATEATLDEVATVLQPGSSVLWTFHDDVLQALLVRQGTRFAPRVGADPQPTAAFVSFFNRAAEISAGLYPREGAGPQVAFALRPQTSEAIPEVRVVVDGQTHAFTRTVAAARTFTWDAERAQTARIVATVGGVEETIATAPNGPWSLFRVLQSAEWERTGTGRYLLRWPTSQPGNPLTAEITFANTAPVFAPEFLGQLECVGQIVR